MIYIQVLKFVTVLDNEPKPIGPKARLSKSASLIRNNAKKRLDNNTKALDPLFSIFIIKF